MEKDTHITEVIFRVDTSKDKWGVFAILPYEMFDTNGNVTVYAHIGQHFSGNYTHCVATSKLAVLEDYKDLKAEMESLGYNLKVIYKRNYDKYLTEYRNLLKK